MAYNFSRTDDYAIIEDTSTSTIILVTRESLPIYSISGSVYVPSNPNAFHCSFSEIGIIDGVTPSDISDAVLRMGKVFKGYPPIKITIE